MKSRLYEILKPHFEILKTIQSELDKEYYGYIDGDELEAAVLLKALIDLDLR